MLADDELAAGLDVHQPLRGDGVEAAAACVLVVHGNHCEVVVNAGADTAVCGKGAGVELGCEALAAGDKLGLLLGGAGNYLLELFLLGGQVLLTDGDAVGQLFDGLLVFVDLVLCVGDVLLVDLTEKIGILEFLADGVVLAAVGDVFRTSPR